MGAKFCTCIQSYIETGNPLLLHLLAFEKKTPFSINYWIAVSTQVE
jgi:hypothetical protein